jgi:hypothetical protein
MKSYEDMARDVLSRINEYEAERKRKRAKNTKIIASVTPVCAATIIGIFVLNSGLSVPTHEQGSNILTEVSGTEQTTSADSTSVGKAAETSTSEAVASVSKTTKSNHTETPTTITTEKNEINESSEINTTEPEHTENVHENNDNNITDITSSTAQPVNTDKPTVTEITFTEIQTTVTAQENTTAISQNVTESDFGGSQNNNDGGNSDNGGGGDRLGTVTINGIFYMQTTTDTTIYTPDIYLGNGGDFKGYYQGDTSIRFYTAKENDEIVIVVFYDGSQLNLEKAAIDIE